MTMFADIFKRQGKAAFGSVMPRKPLEDQVRVLYQRLHEIEDIGELSKSRAWIRMRKLLLSQVESCERNIVELAADPLKNRVALIEMRAMHDVLAAVVTIQDNLPIEGSKIRAAIDKRLTILKATSRDPRPSGEEDNFIDDDPPERGNND